MFNWVLNMPLDAVFSLMDFIVDSGVFIVNSENMRESVIQHYYYFENFIVCQSYITPYVRTI